MICCYFLYIQNYWITIKRVCSCNPTFSQPLIDEITSLFYKQEESAESLQQKQKAAPCIEQLNEQLHRCERDTLGMEEKHCDGVAVVVVLIRRSRSETFFSSKWETGWPGALQLLRFPRPVRRLSCYCGCCTLETQ